MASSLSRVAQVFLEHQEFHKARLFLQEANDWYELTNISQQATRMKILIAESWISQIDNATSDSTRRSLVSVAHYNKAIQTYRSIPKKDRAAQNIDQRILKLRKLVDETNETVVSDLQKFELSTIVITELIELTTSQLEGRELIEAMLIFVHLGADIDLNQIQEQVLQLNEEFPLINLVNTTIVNRSGQKVASRPSFSFGIDGSPLNEPWLRDRMMQQYRIAVQVKSVGSIIPGVEVLHLEHRLSESDFIYLVENSSMVPSERARLFGKALFTGYDGDFITAVHLLIPQIENLVRVLLKQTEATTTHLDKDGNETENGLNTLLDNPEAQKVLGDRLLFELKSLLCDPAGPNLRNAIAHGLLEESELMSNYCVYVWWLGFRLTLNTWWMYGRHQAQDKTSSPK